MPAAFKPLARGVSTRVLAVLSHLHRVGMEEDIKWTRQLGARMLRVLVLAGMSFQSNQIPVRASALTYTTILSFIPFVVILSAVAGQFGYLDLLSRLLPYLNESLGLNLPLDMILGVIENAQKVDFHRLGLIGSFALLFTFMLSMNNIELAIDHIWDIRKDRNWWRQVKAYLPFLVLLIGLVVAAGNIILKYREFLDTKVAGDAAPGLVRDTIVLLSIVGIIGFLFIGLFLLFFLIPNTKVRPLPAALGATLSTLAIILLSRFMILFPNFFVSRNNFIYGSLAAVPVLLLVVYIFWLMVLFGAAVAFIYQRLYHSREKTSAPGPGDSPAFHRMERDVIEVLKAVHAISGSKAVGGRKAVSAEALAGELWDDVATLEALAAPLVNLGLIVKRRVRSGSVYAPRKPITEVDLTAIHNLLLRLDPQGVGKFRSLTAIDELKYTLGILYSSGNLNPPLYLSSVISGTPRHKE